MEDYTCAGEQPFVALPDTDRYPDPLAAATSRLFPRRPINGDYFFILYDARRNKAGWYDYRDPIMLDADGVALPPHQIPLSGWDFLPAVYSREKIAVHVCNLRISDSLTVTMSPTPMPENGADFRGVSPSTAVSLVAATDTLLSSGATGVAATPGSLGYSSSAALSVGAVAGYTAGATAPAKPTDPAGTPPSYTDATITIDPNQLANLMKLVAHDSQSVQNDVAQFRFGHFPGIQPLPGSITRVTTEANTLLAALPPIPSGVLQAEDSPEYNPGRFNHFADETSALAGEINALGTALGSTSLGARVETIRTNFATLQGIVNLVSSIENADADINSRPVPAGGAPCDGSKADTATCRYLEKTAFYNFLRGYCGDIDVAHTDNPFPVGAAPNYAAITPNLHKPECLSYGETDAQNALISVDALHDDLALLDLTAGGIFRRMNDWYENSRIDATDILTPAGTNAVERINILIHRTYVPFTIVGSSQISSSSAAGGGGAGSAAATGAGAGGGAGGAGAGAGGAGAASGGAASGAGAAAGGAAGTTATASSASATTSAAGGASVTSNAGFTAETVLMEVHRRANFNLVGGAMAIRIPTNNYTLVPEVALPTANSPANIAAGQPAYTYSATCNGASASAINIPVTPPTNNGSWPASEPFFCIAKQQSTDWQAAGMVGVAWFPLGRDYFPYGTGGSIRKWRNYSPSLLAATSVTSLGNFFLGPDVEPANGINFFAGIAAGHQNTLPSGVSLNNPLLPVGSSNSSPTLPTATHEKWGIAVGIGFDLTVSTQIFGKASGASAP
jgi:hypothetical protein